MNLNNIIQLYGYDFIFKDMIVDSRLNKETVINSIMDYNAEFIPQYPEGCLLQKKIKTWSERIESGVSKMLDALLSDYKPLENAQRVEMTHEVSSSNRDNTEKRNRNESYDNTSTDSVSAYDETGYTPRSQSEDENSGEITENNSLKSDENGTRDIEYTLHGSIGVVTPQDMIEKELKLREFNIYKWIAQDFFNELMLGVIE